MMKRLCVGFGNSSMIKYPIGGGLVLFNGAEDAMSALQRVQSDYPSHCKAAREFAELHLDADRILPAMFRVALADKPSETTEDLRLLRSGSGGP